MAGFAIDGIVSGIKASEMIAATMAVEALPKRQLEAQSQSKSDEIKALQALNVKITSILDNAKLAATKKTYATYAATSSSESVKAAINSITGAQANGSSLTFDVSQIARSQSTISAAGATVDDFTGGAGAITIKKADGSLVEITSDSTNLSAFVKDLNAKTGETGVTASLIQVDGQARIQFTGTDTGASNGFEVYQGTAAGYSGDPSAGVRVDSTTLRQAQDAKIVLWSGVAGLEQEISQASNIFSGVIEGLDFTVTKEEQGVTVGSTRDTEVVGKAAKNLVESLNTVLAEIKARTAATTTTKPDGSTAVKGGILSGISVVRSASLSLSSALSYPVDGASPSTIGIEVTKDGDFTFDEDKFAAAYAADPEGTEKFLTALGERMESAAKTLSDPYEGTLSLTIQNAESRVKTMGDQISSWENRLAKRQETLERQYTAMELSLSKWSSIGNQLAGALASLSGSNSGK